jgi:hypothetical protein
MAGAEPGSDHEVILRMQEGVRDWVRRTARKGQEGSRRAAPLGLLSLLCASAFGPLLAAGSGITDAAVGAGIGVLSSVGSGALGSVIVEALDRARGRGEGAAARADLEKEVARQIQTVLEADDASAPALRAEIAIVLKQIDAAGTALQEAFETGNEQVRHDVVAAIGEIGAGFAELRFLLGDISATATAIQENQDVHGAQLRVIADRAGWAATEARLTREEVAAWRHSRSEPTSGDGTGEPGPRWVRGSPYRGLLPFEETDAEVFYGRERLVAELAGKLAGLLSRPGLLIVTGASGAGKSSLLRAGLLPALARGLQLPEAASWPCRVLTPTGHPLTELAAQLAALGGADPVSLRRELAQHPAEAHLAVRAAVLADVARRAGRHQPPGDGDERLVLILDQFEQVFTLNQGGGAEAERLAFLTAVCAAATSPTGPDLRPPALVVVAVRGDFWDRCAAYPVLAGALGNAHLVVEAMSESDLRLAITGPADAAGLRIDLALTDAILSDLRATSGDNAAGALPLLSQAMLSTWNNREGDRLTSHGYARAGGVSHAVQNSADEVYDAAALV